MKSLFLRRIAAFVTDVALLFAVLAPLGYAVQQLIGVSPTTPRGVYAVLLVNFSLPVWTYFAFSDCSDRGATVGKRLLGVRTDGDAGGRLGPFRALLRTALKMLPWELSHASAFLFAPALGAFQAVNWTGLGAAYALTLVYLGVAWRNGGRRSVHDLAVSTSVVPD